MASKRFWVLMVVLAVSGMSAGANVDFEDLFLGAESYWYGSDGSGGFTSGGVHFSNNYDSLYGSWDGFAYSNITDTEAWGYMAQYNAITGSGEGESANYAVSYVGWAGPPTMTLDVEGVVDGLNVTNTNYAYYSMRDGDMYAKKFGGASGDEPDWFMLTITGKDAAGGVTGIVNFYLADFRFADSASDYILNTWQFVDTSSLGAVKSLEFGLSSSDVGDWGMNTPASFAIDTVIPGPAAIRLMGLEDVSVNGYVDPNERWERADPADANAIVNPLFKGWAVEVVSYEPAVGVSPQWADASMALGQVTGDRLDIVSLGDLEQSQIDAGFAPGQITVTFAEPVRDGAGYDFAVFENGLISNANYSTGSVTGQMFAELGYVEVSSNGVDFVRFPSVSLTPELVGPYGTIEVSDVFNLAGKHPNGRGICTGTPFDLRDIACHPLVLDGTVDINDIGYVRIVDVPGSGDFFDEATAYIDPESWPAWDYYGSNHAIYDAWLTWDSGGFDLEAVGVLHEQQYSADIDLNGVVDLFDFALLANSWGSHFGQDSWIGRCDLAEPGDLVVGALDLAEFASQWLAIEQWRAK